MKNILSIFTAVLFAAFASILTAGAANVAGADLLSTKIIAGSVFCFSTVASFAPTELNLFAGIYAPVMGNSNRAVFDAMRAEYAKKGQTPVITASYLRSEVILGTTSTVRFPILTQDSSPNVNERRLNVADAFQVTSLGIFIYKIATGANISSGILNTFPNPLVYTGSGEAANLQGIYNGSLNVTIDRKEIIPAIDCLNFYNVGIAQQAVLTAASGTGNAYQASQYTNDFGFYTVTPTFKMSGNLVNEITLNLPESVNLAGTSSTNRVVLITRGFLIQGGAQFK